MKLYEQYIDRVCIWQEIIIIVTIVPKLFDIRYILKSYGPVLCYVVIQSDTNWTFYFVRLMYYHSLFLCHNLTKIYTNTDIS